MKCEHTVYIIHLSRPLGGPQKVTAVARSMDNLCSGPRLQASMDHVRTRLDQTQMNTTTVHNIQGTGSSSLDRGYS